MRYNNLFGLYIATICTLYLKALYGIGSGALYRNRRVVPVRCNTYLNEYRKTPLAGMTASGVFAFAFTVTFAFTFTKHLPD